jgi:imidazole glycerol-phosphate synthase subunit HisH
MSVAIVDYGSGNLHSAKKAFERAARLLGLDVDVCIAADPASIRSAERIVLPGVGAFGDCRRGLEAIGGLIDALTEEVCGRGKPFLGICVGMQLLATRGLEHQPTPGLGWIAGEVCLIEPSSPTLKIPHMGWNTLRAEQDHALLADIKTGEEGQHAYFVHSYQFKVAANSTLIAQTDYGGPVTAIVGRDNIAGTQFHPEKSQRLGLTLIGNFLRWRP